MRARRETIIVYNRHADALALVDKLKLPASQISIGIRQGTRGVPGLQALRWRDHDKETLELIYEKR